MRNFGSTQEVKSVQGVGAAGLAFMLGIPPLLFKAAAHAEDKQVQF